MRIAFPPSGSAGCAARLPPAGGDSSTTGDGYRYDHAFCSADPGAAIADCTYLHQPRKDRLSDHSALTARLNLEPSPALLVSDPVAAVTPATLF
jgi:exodeoxyribonuclease III